MQKHERFQVILEQLSKGQRVLLPDLSTLLNVSEDTVRRDIRELSDQGQLKAVRGGAVAHSPGPLHFRDRINYGGAQKKAIAQKALNFLQDGQVVVFDGGTSALLTASLLPSDLRLTVVTNSFPVASILEEHPHVEVLFAGGRLMKNSFVTVGMETIRFFQKFTPDICFLGICSIHTELGVTGPDYEESEVKQAMIGRAQKVIALAAVEKLDTAEAYQVCPTERLSVIVTDNLSAVPDAGRYTGMGIELF